MEGQGVAASAAAAAGGQGKPGAGAVAAPEFGYPADSFVTSSITNGGEDQGDNRPPSPDSSPSAPQECRTEFSSQQIKSDKADNIVDPDRNNGVIAKDGNTGHKQTAGGLAPSSGSEPAAGSVPPEISEPATEQFAAIPPGDAETLAG